MLSRCPRYRRLCLDKTDCSESSLYRSHHLICNQCFDNEDDEIEAKGTNDLPDTLATYGPRNDYN